MNQKDDGGPDDTRMLREMPFAYGEERPALRIAPRIQGAEDGPAAPRRGKMKTSVYLEPRDVERLAWLAELEGRPRAEILRDAIRAYEPPVRERHFHLFDSGEGDGRSLADMSDEEMAELMNGFGADAFGEVSDEDLAELMRKYGLPAPS